MNEKHIGTKGKTQAQGTNSPTPRLLSLRAAAGYLGLTVWAMRERIWAGDIPVVRFPGGRKQFIDSKDIESFIEKNKTVIR